jgi:hypothetical protein
VVTIVGRMVRRVAGGVRLRVVAGGVGVLAGTVAVLGLSALPASAAVATAPSPVSDEALPPVGVDVLDEQGRHVLMYTGTMVYSAMAPDNVTPAGIPEQTFADVWMEVVCDETACEATWWNQTAQVLSMSGGVGTGQWQVEQSYVDVCDSSTIQYAAQSEIRIDNQTASAMVTTFGFDIVPEGQCDSVDAYGGTVSSFEGVLTSGDACALTFSCPAATGGFGSRPGGVQGLAAGDGSIGAPSVLSTLAKPAQSISTQQVVTAVVVTLVLVVLMGLPTTLASNASEKALDRITAWWAKVRTRARNRERVVEEDPVAEEYPMAEAAPAGWWVRVTGFGRGLPITIATVIVASFLGGFSDPGFGTTVGTWRMWASMLAGIGIDIAIGWLAFYALNRALHKASITFEAKVGSLVIVVLTVIFTRTTGFQPAIVFGAVAGVAFATTMANQKIRLTLTSLGWGFGLGLAAWIAYANITAPAADHVWAVLGYETLSSLTIAGIAALPLTLIPVRGMSGWDIFAWRRWAWGICYGVGLLAFFLVVMPMPFAWGEVQASLATWIAMFAAYAAVATAFWLIMTKPWKPKPPTTEATDKPVELTSPQPS